MIRPSARLLASSIVFVFVFAATAAPRAAVALTTTGLHYQAINASGAERGFGAAIEESWGAAIPGVEGSTYAWPNPDTNTNVAVIDSTLLKGGMNTVRLPFQWERLQPTLNEAFDASYLAKLRATAEALRRRGATVLLDPHNYAYYKVLGRGTAATGQHIGSAEVPISAFVDLWRRLAQEFGSTSKSHPFLFGLMNEPHDISVSVWVSAAQQAVNAIRGTGAKNLILVPGADWTTANDFAWSQNSALLQSVTDPDDNMAIEVHQYYDGTCTATGYVDKLKPFEDWAVAHSRVAFLGEIGRRTDPGCQQAFDNLLAHLVVRAAGTTGGVWIGYGYWAIDSSSTGSGQSFVTGPYTDLQAILPTTCGSNAKDGRETDVDCGGVCRRCADGKVCTAATDCQSGFCTGNVCSGSGTGAGGNSGGGGAGGAGGVGGSGGAPGSGGVSGSGGSTGNAGEAGCACRSVGSRGSSPHVIALVLIPGVALLRRSRRRRRGLNLV